jgi:UDPglucose--hexose-1-phosphate uridylyltransferase
VTGSERRLNLLTGEWILVSPERMSRPWHGAEAKEPSPAPAHHDRNCNLCPRSARMNGANNPDYRGIHVFDNDFPALSSGPLQQLADDPILVREAETGACRVICYSPDHAGRMATMSALQIREVIDAWTRQFAELDARPDIGAVAIFENHGEMAGASNPHPHGQIWATSSIPNELAKEDAHQRSWLETRGTPLLTDYLRHELELGTRVVFSNEAFAVLVPFWAVWPFETIVLPIRAVSALTDLLEDERTALAETLSRLTRSYDRVFNAPFPYSMGIHQRPCRAPAPHFTLHMHFFPPLLRSASIRKFMVGFELLAMPQRDLTPEAAAAKLRSLL